MKSTSSGCISTAISRHINLRLEQDVVHLQRVVAVRHAWRGGATGERTHDIKHDHEDV
jgi:hypothetical protein